MRRDPEEPAQHLAHLPEIEAGIEELDQIEDVALGGACADPTNHDRRG